ncbi:MAG: glutamate 5-kinase [Chthoniobacterales bacterium]
MPTNEHPNADSKTARRIVIKLGTGVLARPLGRTLDTSQFRRLCDEFAQLVSSGDQCIVVSSGAVTAGLGVLGLSDRPIDLPGKQACASIGQPRLIRTWDTGLRRHGLSAAQLLLTHDDIDSRRRHANARNTLERLLAARNVLPIINENDSVATEELNFGDNDRLSAEVAILAQADLLVILTASDGVMDRGERVPVINDIESAFAFVTNEKGPNSVGGMGAKLSAVRLAVHAGITTVVADGREPDRIADALAGRDVGTRFPASTRKKKPSRK